MAVKEGDFIRLNYTGTVQETGEIFDTTDEEIAEEAGLKTENKVFQCNTNCSRSSPCLERP
ncbi:MAG: hypothetical protein PQ975_00390 [Methanobacterium sp.]|jgi:FKBP-type peptidyl-prolyl cis-trans isomerase 2